MHLTKSTVDAANLPESGQRFIRDDDVTGFALRVLATGGKTFIWEGRINGRPRRITIGQYPDFSVAEARKRAVDIRGSVARGDDPHSDRQAKKHEPTFGELAQRYMSEYSHVHKRANSTRNDELILRSYVPDAWKGRQLSEIGRDDIERLHNRIGSENGKYAANHTVRLLRHMFNLAGDWEMLLGDNPAARIRQFKETRRERFLTPDELHRVNNALMQEPDWRWKAYFPLLLMMGTRRGELLSARWSDFDLDAITWRIPETKAGHSHLLPVPGPVVEILRSLPSRGVSEWVFPGDGKTGHLVEVKTAWQRIRNRAGVPDVRVHDLRHTLASWMVAGGYGLSIIGKALNHSQIATTERYAHLALDPVREALERTAAQMAQAGLGVADEAPESPIPMRRVAQG